CTSPPAGSTVPRPRKRAAVLLIGAGGLFFLGTNVQAGWLFVLAAFLVGTALAGIVLPGRLVRRLLVERHAPDEVNQLDERRHDPGASGRRAAGTPLVPRTGRHARSGDPPGAPDGSRARVPGRPRVSTRRQHATRPLALDRAHRNRHGQGVRGRNDAPPGDRRRHLAGRRRRADAARSVLLR